MRPEPQDPEFRARVTTSFSRQAFMGTIGASLELVESGEVHIALPFSKQLAQQHGYLHAGVTAAIADSANGYAALTLAPPEARGLGGGIQDQPNGAGIGPPISRPRTGSYARSSPFCLPCRSRRFKRCGSGGDRDHVVDDQHQTEWSAGL